MIEQHGARRARLAACALCAAGFAAAQPPQHSDGSRAPRLRIQIVCDRWGSEIPRAPAAHAAAARRQKAFDLADHEVRFFVGSQACRDLAELARELVRWRSVPGGAFSGEGVVALVEAGPDVCVDDVVGATDRLVAAGFAAVRFAVAPDVPVVLCAVATTESTALVPAPSSTAEPAAAHRWQPPALRVQQNGVIRRGEDVVHDPKRGADGADLRAEVERITAEPEAQSMRRGERTATGLREYVDTPLRIEADRWTLWTSVARVLEICAPRFNGVELAVVRAEPRPAGQDR